MIISKHKTCHEDNKMGQCDRVTSGTKLDWFLKESLRRYHVHNSRKEPTLEM